LAASAVEHRIGQCREPLRLLHDEADDVVDRLDRLDDRPDRREQAEQPLDPLDDDRVADEGLDAVHHGLAQLSDPLDELLPGGGEALGRDGGQERQHLLEDPQAAVAEHLGEPGAQARPREVEHLQGDGDDAAQVELLRDLQPGALERAEQPGGEAALEVVADVPGELAEALAHGVAEVPEELDGVRDDQRERVARAADDAHDARGERAGEREHALDDQLEDHGADVAGERPEPSQRLGEDLEDALDRGGGLEDVPAGDPGQGAVDEPADVLPREAE